jgi:formate--tetrahydrofolate ligase
MNNLAIAQSAKPKPILQVAEEAGLSSEEFEPLGRLKGKLTYAGMERLRGGSKDGRLVLVTAITPTPQGEGKTTMCIGLAQGLARLGRKAVPAIREPAMGPIFGIKGGACGGGYSQVLPMEDINLNFTGDIPSIAAAHNLLAAMLDAHVHHGNALDIDVRNVSLPRTVDMNDRALREIVVGLGGKANGYPRADGFVVAPASEVMATLCLSETLLELKKRLGDIIVALTPDNKAVTARDLKADGAMAAILRDAIRPNLVQTIEGGPAFVHGGPFANIAHGTSSLIATKCALGMSEFVVTEAGFGADLGAEKFMNIVAPLLGRGPDVIVLVATLRALAYHGEGDWRAGMPNLLHHVSHLRHYGPPLIVALNLRAEDAQDDVEGFLSACRDEGLEAVAASPWMDGGAGCTALAERAAQLAQEDAPFRTLYEVTDPEQEKIDAIVRVAYGGERAVFSEAALRHLEWAEEHGFPNLPFCVAKTQYSLSASSGLKNAPRGFEIRLNDVKLSAGAGFLVAQAGNILLMPGLGSEPAAVHMDVDASGRISGLF